MNARLAPCPYCGQDARLEPDNPWRPFCSERCKMVDLGHWLQEDYAIPAEAPDDDLGGPSSPQ